MDYEQALSELKRGKKNWQLQLIDRDHAVRWMSWHRKLSWSTWLDGPDKDGRIWLTYRGTELVHYHREHIELNFGEWRTLTSMQQVSEHTPFQAYSSDGYGLLGTPTKTRSLRNSMSLKYDGTLLDDESAHLNDIDVQEYYSKLSSYISGYIHKLVYGKLPAPIDFADPRRRTLPPTTPRTIVELVMLGEQPSWLMDRALRWMSPAAHKTLLPGCWSENYWQWLKPRSRRRQTLLYALELEGKRLPLEAKPVLHYRMFKEQLTNSLLEAVGLEKVERPGR